MAYLPVLVLSLALIPASLVSAVHISRLRAGIPNPKAHRDLARRLDLKAPTTDDNIAFVQIGPTPTKTPNTSATKSSAAQWLSFNDNGSGASASVPQATDVNLAGAGDGNAGGGSAQNDVEGAQVISEQGPLPSASVSSSAPVQSPATGGLGPQTQEEVGKWIQAHNEARKAHGAGELKWREDLSWGAKTNAERCKEGHT